LESREAYAVEAGGELEESEWARRAGWGVEDDELVRGGEG